MLFINATINTFDALTLTMAMEKIVEFVYYVMPTLMCVMTIGVGMAAHNLLRFTMGLRMTLMEMEITELVSIEEDGENIKVHIAFARIISMIGELAINRLKSSLYFKLLCLSVFMYKTITKLKNGDIKYEELIN